MKKSAKSSKQKLTDIQREITEDIISALESGVSPWHCPWSKSGISGIPQNYSTKASYSGFNVLILLHSARKSGYVTPYWMTFKQAKALGGHVKKGERATTCVYYGTAKVNNSDSAENDEETYYRFPKFFSVFNIDQIDGIEFPELQEKPDKFETEDHILLENAQKILNPYLNAEKIPVNHFGDAAFYTPSADTIQMPTKEQFESMSAYVSTLAHEIVHSTGHKNRLARFEQNTQMFESYDEAYAFEELVACSAEAFFCAQLGIDHELGNHSSYIGSWLKVLKNDHSLVFKAAARSSQALELIQSFNAIEERLAA